MKSNLYTNVVLTVIAVCLILITANIYFTPKELQAESNPASSTTKATEIYVYGGYITIENVREIARAIHREIDGMSVTTY